MTYTTLTVIQNGTPVEKSLGDWGIVNDEREVSNQSHDSLGFDVVKNSALSLDTFPFGTRIVLQIGRQSNPPRNQIGGPTAFTGGQFWYVGYRIKHSRAFQGRSHTFEYQFAGIWEFLFARLVFQKKWLTYVASAVNAQNKTGLVAAWRDTVVLGQSLSLVTMDLLPGTVATNYLSIRQQVQEIAGYCAAQSSAEQTYDTTGTWPAGAQFKFDALQTDESGNYILQETITPNLTIPDFFDGNTASGLTSNIQIGTSTAIPLRAPLDAVNQLTCSECMMKELRWLGSLGNPVVWFDHSQMQSIYDVPTLKISTRDLLPSKTLNYSGNVTQLKIQRRDDLVPPAIALKYHVSGQSINEQYSYIVNDICTTINGEMVEGIGLDYGLTDIHGNLLSQSVISQLEASARRFNDTLATIDFQGASITAASAAITSIAFTPGSQPNTTTSPYAPAQFTPNGLVTANSPTFWQLMFPDLNHPVNGGSTIWGIGQGLITSGAQAPSAVDDYGNPLTLLLDGSSGLGPGILIGDGTPTDPYLVLNAVVVDGNVATWMKTGSGQNIVAMDATITVYFDRSKAPATSSKTGTAKPLGSDAADCRTLRKTFCNYNTNGQSKLFYSQPTVSQYAEPLPVGLAKFIYNIERNVQCEGQYTFVENEITDPCPIGTALNLALNAQQASLYPEIAKEWGQMNACLQTVHYDLTRRKTTLIFGPADRLGPTDLVERLRVNRGPRWLYLIGNDMQNSGSNGAIELGSSVPKHGPQPGANIPSQISMGSAGNISDFQNNSYPAAGGGAAIMPALNLDSTGSGPSQDPVSDPYANAAPGQSTNIAGLIAMVTGQNGSYNTIAQKTVGTGYFRISIADINAILAACPAGTILGNGGLMFRAVPVCENGQQGFRIVFASEFINVAPPTSLPYK